MSTVHKSSSPEKIEETTSITRDNVDASDQRLLDLGYKPEFRREMSLFGVLGISFCAIGILTGMSSAFQTGLFSGGPLGLFWGWNVSRSLFRFAFLRLLERHLTGMIDMQFFHVSHCPQSSRDL
ncbi:hypothetical protein J3R82DRAFT_8130 [Butyriboletus roseoflavus]|nr:hypothetical protein J3R82DRAFT_8130 [Butyriboletus roseoflavus]